VGIVANRIAKGKFSLDGKEYSLEINNPPDNLHSGSKGVSRTIWKAEPLHERHAAAVRFTSVSPISCWVLFFWCELKLHANTNIGVPEAPV
jgi:aldose 1-epimerase